MVRKTSGVSYWDGEADTEASSGAFAQAPRARRYRSMRVSASGEASRTRAQSRSRGPGSPSPSSHRPCASRRGVSGGEIAVSALAHVRELRFGQAPSLARAHRRHASARPSAAAMPLAALRASSANSSMPESAALRDV